MSELKVGTAGEYIHKDGEVIPVILVAIDPKFGITIVKEDNPEKHMMCLHGPKSLLGRLHSPFYQQMYDYVVDRMTNGKPLKVDELSPMVDILYEEHTNLGGIADCAF